MLLYTAYLVRHIIEQENANPCLIKGILVLPTAFHPFPISDESEKKNIFANGFATLKEIDYYMNPNVETSYTVKYTENKEIVSNKAPFDVCYLIDDENEEFPIGGLDDTLDAIAESLTVLLTAGIGTSIKSAEDNL
ncbi:MAG: tubulin-like doman-containing protein, partial [Candidatus Methanomethylicia archaeon]